MRRSPVKLIAYQWLLLLGLVIFTGCSDEKGHQPLVPIQAEDTGKTGSKTDGTEQAFVGPSYEEILPILKDKCAACHVWHTNKAALDDAAKRGTLNSFISDLTKSPPAMAAMLSTTLKPQEKTQILAYAKGVNAPKIAKSPTGASTDGNAGTTPQSCPDTQMTTQVQSASQAEASLPELTEYEKIQLANKNSNLLGQCTNCHGPMGMGQFFDVPHIGGLSESYLLSQLRGFKQMQFDDKGELELQKIDAYSAVDPRVSESPTGMTMHILTSNLSDSELKYLSLYYSQLEPFSAGTKEDTEGLFVKCQACHTGAKNAFGPRIRGQQATYIANQLRAFKSGKRKNAAMSTVAAEIPDEEIDALAKYISDLKTN